MTTFYAKSKMAYPEYRYDILDSNRRHTIYETDGRLRLGGNSVVFTKADTEEKVIMVSRVPDAKHHYTADFVDGSSASLERLEWKPFHPSISIKTADAEFLLEGSSGSGKFTITQEDKIIAKITRPGFVLKYNYALEILDDNLQELVLAAFMVLSHYIGGRRGFVVVTG